MSQPPADSPSGGARGSRLRLRPLTERVEVGSRYTRFVGLMRWLLAFGAVALAVTLVVWPSFTGRNSGTSPLLVATTGEVEDGRPTMKNARFLATDDSGQPYTITAELAWQEQGVEEIIFMEVLEGDILLESGAWVTISADRGVFDQTEQLLILESNVDLYSDVGYELHTAYAEIDLASGTAQGDMQVEGQGPTGLLSAGGFQITENGDRLRFTGPVHMTVFPGEQP